MRILVVGTGGALAGSGISTAADQTWSLLRAMGHDAQRVIAGDRLRSKPNALNLENVTAVFAEAATVARAASRQRSDLVWLHTFGVPLLPSMRTLVQALAVRCVRRRLVIRFHAFALEDHVEAGGRTLRAVLACLRRLADALVVEHEPAANALRSAVDSEKVRVLHNWVEVPDEPAPLPDGSTVWLVFVGGLTERKGVPQLLDAMRLLRDADVALTIVGGPGDDGPEVAAAIESSAADLVEAGTVKFVGQLGAAQVREELRRAHLFVLPSRAEGMPLAMLEAMAEARPLLVGDAGNMREIVTRFRCGEALRSPGAQELADAIRDMAHDRVGLAERGRRSHAAAKAEFSAAALRRSMDDLLRRTSARG